MDKYDLKIEPAADPDLINWHSLSPKSYFDWCPCCFSWTLLLAAIFYVFLWRTDFYAAFEAEYPLYIPQNFEPELRSQQLPVTKVDLAQEDYADGTIRYTADAQVREKVGYVSFYCLYQMFVLETPPYLLMFPSTIDPVTLLPYTPYYCMDVAEHIEFRELILPALAVLLAILAISLISLMNCCIRTCQRHQTYNDLYTAMIGSATVLVFFAIVVLPLCALIKSDLLLSILHVEIDLGFLGGLVPIELPLGGKYSLKVVDDYIPFFKGKYDDVNLGWYRDSGVLLLMTAILFLVFTQLYRLIGICCLRCRLSCDRCRCCLCCRCESGTCQYTQDDLNKLYSGSEFDIAYSYQLLHTITWLTMTFAATMPVMYSIGFLFYLSKYYMDKYMVLNYHRRPHSFDETLAFEQSWYFKWPILMHVAFSLISLSSNQMFFEAKLQSEHIGLNIEDINKIPILDRVNHTLPDFGPISKDLIPLKQSVWDRFMSLHMILLYLFWIIVLIIYILQEKVEICIEAICAKCRGDGEYDDYDSEAEEADIRYQESHCEECEARKDERQRKRAEVRKRLGLQFRDNNLLDKDAGQPKKDAAEKLKPPSRYADSSEEEKREIGTDHSSDSGSEENLVNYKGHYSDDFLREISLDYLVYYFDKNNFELQKTI